MVFFVCGGCGSNMKRKQADQHRFRCKNWQFSCLDCQADFEGDSYVQHTKCITESEKYYGQFHVEKNKPDKNEIWMDKLRHHFAQQKQDKFVSRLLDRIISYPNVPRKAKPFKNFLSTNMNMRDPKITAQLWEIVEGANAVDLDAVNKKNTDKSTLNKENKPSEKGENLKNGVSNGATESSTNGVSKNGITDDAKSELSNGDSKKKSKKRKQKEVEEEEEEEEQEQLPKETKSAKKRRLKKTSGATEEPLAGEVQEGVENVDVTTEEGLVKFKWRRALKKILHDAPPQGMKINKLLSKVERIYNDPVTGAKEKKSREALLGIMMKVISKKPFSLKENMVKKGAFAKAKEDDSDSD